jgi:hypothetical protein
MTEANFANKQEQQHCEQQLTFWAIKDRYAIMQNYR